MRWSFEKPMKTIHWIEKLDVQRSCGHDVRIKPENLVKTGNIYVKRAKERKKIAWSHGMVRTKTQT